MSLVIFGAHGKVGKNLVSLAAKSLKVTAIIRSDEQAKAIKEIASNVETANLTLDKATVSEIENVIKGHNTVIFIAGSGGKNLLQVDLDGAVKTFEATTKANIKRYILLSAVNADNREFIDKSSIKNYYIAKHYADRILINEFRNLNYTIVKPSLLSDGNPTGKIKFLEPNEDVGSIDRNDVARVLLDIIDNESTFGKSYNIASGNLSINDATIYK
ncbi:unnamed protein product [Candida verbasci]|uniref:NAD(P)-binding domain-containing protein n=1 Tax=Candida verbasci TaxID=1227364 RepID=A0A9W4TR42_9ASCO|nr:unnamed protein product [Candida verbasci]